MTQIYLAFDGGLAILRQRGETWTPRLALTGYDCQCLAGDPHRPQRAYCGTFDAGLWRSDDAGATWQPVTGEPLHHAVMAVAVSPLEQGEDGGVVWAGTEPSALFRSEDGGSAWQEKSSLQALPSKPTWSFPPRPWTHHVRWIEPDATVADRIFVGIELGGVMRSLDGGESWEDRKPHSQHDCHTLRTHRLAPGLVYEAAGDGYAESQDGGATWQGADRGLHNHYLWGLAVDPADPATVIVSASPGPSAAHNDRYAEAQLYRKQKESAWQPIESGLPAAHGTRAFVLATHATQPGVFYAATRGDVYRSSDGGREWEKLVIAWPEPRPYITVNALELAETA